MIFFFFWVFFFRHVENLESSFQILPWLWSVSGWQNIKNSGLDCVDHNKTIYYEAPLSNGEQKGHNPFVLNKVQKYHL